MKALRLSIQHAKQVIARSKLEDQKTWKTAGMSRRACELLSSPSSLL
jgi:hypothetical protein